MNRCKTKKKFFFEISKTRDANQNTDAEKQKSRLNFSRHVKTYRTQIEQNYFEDLFFSAKN